MMTALATLTFMGAFGTAGYAIVASVAPQWRRIARLAAGHIEQPFSPLAQLAVAERRIAVRRWAASPAPAPVHRLRAAA